MNIDGQEYISHYGLWPVEERSKTICPHGFRIKPGQEARWNDPGAILEIEPIESRAVDRLLARVFQKLDFGKLE